MHFLSLWLLVLREVITRNPGFLSPMGKGAKLWIFPFKKEKTTGNQPVIRCLGMVGVAVTRGRWRHARVHTCDRPIAR